MIYHQPECMPVRLSVDRRSSIVVVVVVVVASSIGRRRHRRAAQPIGSVGQFHRRSGRYLPRVGPFARPCSATHAVPSRLDRSGTRCSALTSAPAATPRGRGSRRSKGRWIPVVSLRVVVPSSQCQTVREHSARVHTTAMSTKAYHAEANYETTKERSADRDRHHRLPPPRAGRRAARARHAARAVRPALPLAAAAAAAAARALSLQPRPMRHALRGPQPGARPPPPAGRHRVRHRRARALGARLVVRVA